MPQQMKSDIPDKSYQVILSGGFAKCNTASVQKISLPMPAIEGEECRGVRVCYKGILRCMQSVSIREYFVQSLRASILDMSPDFRVPATPQTALVFFNALHFHKVKPIFAAKIIVE